MAHATAGKVFSEKSNRLQELDLAMTGTQSSSLSCDTMPLGHAAYPRYPFDRSSSVCSTAGTLTRPMAHAQGAAHGVPSQTMRASSQGSKVRSTRIRLLSVEPLKQFAGARDGDRHISAR